ncbi:MAG: tyrosine-type recombinase/integrase [Nitrososphaeria archaeon]
MKVPEVLTEDEVQAMIDKAPKLRDKAFIAVLYEGGFRIGEILPATLGDLQFDENGARLRVHGKTGGRTVRLITSAPLLARWVDEHPYKDNPEAPIWISLTKNFQKKLQPMKYHYVTQMLKETAKKAGIKKRIYPHIFRHSAATRDARYLTESELKLKYGWAGGSNMAEVYVHLSGADLDNKLLAIYAGRPVETIRPKFAPIICPKCGQENTPGQRYCGRCGTPLSAQELVRGTVEIEELKKEISELKELLRGALQASQARK